MKVVRAATMALLLVSLLTAPVWARRHRRERKDDPPQGVLLFWSSVEEELVVAPGDAAGAPGDTQTVSAQDFTPPLFRTRAVFVRTFGDFQDGEWVTITGDDGGSTCQSTVVSAETEYDATDDFDIGDGCGTDTDHLSFTATTNVDNSQVEVDVAVDVIVPEI